MSSWVLISQKVCLCKFVANLVCCGRTHWTWQIAPWRKYVHLIFAASYGQPSEKTKSLKLVLKSSLRSTTYISFEISLKDLKIKFNCEITFTSVPSEPSWMIVSVGIDRFPRVGSCSWGPELQQEPHNHSSHTATTHTQRQLTQPQTQQPHTQLNNLWHSLRINLASL